MFFSVLPVHHNQVHKHLKCLGMDENSNSLGQIHEQLVVKQIGVLTLQRLICTSDFEVGADIFINIACERLRLPPGAPWCLLLSGKMSVVKFPKRTYPCWVVQ